MRNVRAMIDHEVRLCDHDELYLVEKNKDIEKYASSLSEFKQKSFEIPNKSCFQLFEIQRELLDHMKQLKCELSNAKEEFLKGLQESFPFQNPDQLSVLTNPVLTFPKEKLLLPNEQSKSSAIKGVIPINNNSDAIQVYFYNKTQLDDQTTGPEDESSQRGIRCNSRV